MRYGYIRVSSHDQNTARQLDGVAVDRMFTDNLSGKNTNRPALQRSCFALRAGVIQCWCIALIGWHAMLRICSAR